MKENLDKVGINYELETLANISKLSFKKIGKEKAHDLALSTLLAKKETHTKVKHLKHDKLYIQS